MVRAAVVMLTMCAASTAAADPIFHLELGASYGWYDRTSAFEQDGDPEPPSVTRMEGSGAGLMVTPAVDFFHDERWRFGAFARLQSHRLERSVDTLVLGPELAFRAPFGFYTRLDAGLGRMSQDGATGLQGFTSYGARSVAAEVGYERRIDPDVQVRCSLVASRVWAHHEERSSDFSSTTTEDARVVSIAVTGGIVFE